MTDEELLAKINDHFSWLKNGEIRIRTANDTDLNEDAYIILNICASDYDWYTDDGSNIYYLENDDAELEWYTTKEINRMLKLKAFL